MRAVPSATFPIQASTENVMFLEECVPKNWISLIFVPAGRLMSDFG